MEAFEQGLREMNFTPGLNLAIELRSPAPGFRTMSTCDGSRPKCSRGALMLSSPHGIPQSATVRRIGANTPVVMIGAVGAPPGDPQSVLLRADEVID